MSPADTLLLVDWLDRGVPVAAMMAAIERCAIARRKRGSRTRFTLTTAKRHLFKPPLVRPDVEPPVDGHAFQPLLEALAEHPDPGAQALRDDLSAVGADEVEAAVTLCARRIDERWSELGAAAREERMVAAVIELGDIANLVDTNTLHELAEEVARHHFRSEWPRLDTATFQLLVHG